MQSQKVSFPSNSSSTQREAGAAVAANQLYYVCPVIFALILPALIGHSELSVLFLYYDTFYVFLGSIPAVAMIRIVYDWAVKNESFVICFFRFLKPLKYLENLPQDIVFESGRKKFSFPYATLILVLCNTTVYFFVPEKVSKDFVFVPYGNPSVPQILVSVFTSAFLHGSASHLINNMLYLLIFGSLVELKIGSTRFLILFFLCEIASTIIFIILLKFKCPDSSLMLSLKNFHSLGASGAVSGIMGLFAVRCFFARLMVCRPFFSLPFLSIPIGIQGTLLAGTFFASDVFGSLTMFESGDNINYWAHLGGYLGGFVLGYCLKLHRDASSEAFEMKSEIMTLKKTIRKGGRLHVAGLKFLLEHYRYDQKKGEFYFVRLIQVLTGNNFKKAIEIFLAYYPNYVNALPGNILLDVGLYFYRTAHFEKAGKCLQLATCKKGPWQGRAKLYLERTLGRIKINNISANLLTESVA
jgi:membrane associated rhomboid family serine protease